MKIYKILTPLILLLAMMLTGGYFYISSELTYLQTFTPPVDVTYDYKSSAAIAIYGQDNLLMYKKYTRISKQIPKDYDLKYMVAIVDLLLDETNTKKSYGIERWKLYLLKSHGIDPLSLKGAVLNHYADKIMQENNLTEVRGEIVRWYTLQRLSTIHANDDLYRIFLDTPKFAENVYGIAGASSYFLSKNITDCSLLEIAFLIAMLNHKDIVDPVANYQQLDKHARYAVRKLYERSIIGHEDYLAQMSNKVVIIYKSYDIIAPYYVNAVLKKVYADKRFDVNEQNLVVRTGYNDNATKLAFYIMQEYMADRPNGLQSAFVLLNRRTKAIEVVIGDKSIYSQYNRAITLKRQVASTFKPIVYLSAFMVGYRPSDQIVDKPYQFGESYYSPNNYESIFMGQVPLRYGLIHSLNNATVRLAEIVGLTRVRNLAVNLGMKSDLRAFYSMALGAYATTPLNLAQTFTTIANLGVRSLPDFAITVENVETGEIYNMIEEERRIVGEASSFQVLNLMRDVASTGTARGAKMLKGTAAKTGTSDKFKDAWTVAIFGDYVAAVWFGYDDFRSIGEASSGGRVAAPFISKFQRAYFKDNETFDIDIPENIVFKNVRRSTGKLTNKKGAGIYLEAYKDDNLPPYE